MLDYHIHIARLPHPENISRVLVERGYRANIIACTPKEWEETVAILPIWKDFATPCFGIHPMEGLFPQKELLRLHELLENNPKAFVGECGLDKRFPGYELGSFQEKSFILQAKLALEFKRPLMIHCVGDYRRILSILEDIGYPQEDSPIIFHRFGGDKETVIRGLQLNAIFSLHANSRKKASTRDAVPLIPKSRLRFETDADESFVPKFFKESSPTASAIADKLIEELSKIQF